MTTEIRHEAARRTLLQSAGALANAPLLGSVNGLHESERILGTRRVTPHRSTSTTIMGKTPLLGFCLLIASVQSSCAPQTRLRSVATPSASAEQEVLRLSREKWRWMAERKLDTLAALFHDQAVFVHMTRTLTKAQELEVIRTGDIQYQRAEIQAASVRFAGNAAIVLNTIRLVAIVRGNEAINPFEVTEVYVPEGGTWKLASLTFTRLLR